MTTNATTRTANIGSCSGSAESPGVPRSVVEVQCSVSDTFKRTGPGDGSIERAGDGNHLLDRFTEKS